MPLLRDLGRRTLLDRQVAHVGVYQLGPAVGEEGRDDSGDAKRDARLHIEAEEGGWWYGCRLPHDRAVTALLSDADLLPNLGNRNSHTLALRRKHTRLLRDMIPDAAPVFHFARLSACSYLCEPIFGEASLLLGDASQSVDPLAGQGITRALWTGMNGGKAVLAHLEGNAQAIRAYAAQLKDGTEIYLRERQQTYRREQRWPCAAYWQRR